MPTYRYTATTSDGKLVQGEVETPDDTQALDVTRSRGLFVTDLRIVGETAGPPPTGYGIRLPKSRRSTLRFWVHVFIVWLVAVCVFLTGYVVTVELTGGRPWAGAIGGAALVYVAAWLAARWSNHLLGLRVAPIGDRRTSA
jgi:hypothetical protein